MKNKKKMIFVAGLLASSLALTPLTANSEAPNKATEFKQTEKIHSTVHELESLFVLMQERLYLMHELARYKWNAGIKERTMDDEEITLQQEGQENDAFIASFFEAQNQAGHRVQKQDFALFQKESVDKFENVKDYDKEIHPQLQAINQEMVSTINQLLVHTQNESLPEFLKELSYGSFQNEGIDREVYNIAVDPLFRD
ncbi:MAG: hypothetical protein S4CHLAM7_07540 [Chlamydiae bacterium]|nr:hypothetical protein [Chlamydiota bacterium]